MDSIRKLIKMKRQRLDLLKVRKKIMALHSNQEQELKDLQEQIQKLEKEAKS